MDVWVFIIVMVSILGGFAFLIVCAVGFFRLLQGRRSARELSREESRMLQDIWNGLQKMETRVSNLETILISRDSPRDSLKDR